MTTGRRRVMLALGAVLLVVGVGTATNALLQRASGYSTEPSYPDIGGVNGQSKTVGTQSSSRSTWPEGDPLDQTLMVSGVIAMAVGAGLIWYAVLKSP